ncbi:hypothetical protein ACFYUK_43185 [Nonomuraea wenchangensis]
MPKNVNTPRRETPIAITSPIIVSTTRELGRRRHIAQHRGEAFTAERSFDNLDGSGQADQARPFLTIDIQHRLDSVRREAAFEIDSRASVPGSCRFNS